MINIEQKSKRLDYFYLVRGIAIILVMLGHIYKNESNIIRIWLYSFHLPIFFVISGCLSKHFGYKDYTISRYIKKKFKSLLIPYVIFSIINGAFYICYSYMTGILSNNLIYSTLVKIFTLRGLCGTWFLPCLFGCEIIFFILIKKINNEKYIKIILFCLFAFSFCNIFNEDSFMCVIIRIFTATGFFSFGYYGYNFVKQIKPKVIYIILLFVLNILLTIYNGHVEIYLILYKNAFVYVLNSLIGSLMIILLCKRINKQRLLSFLGRNSLIVLVTHFMIVTALMLIYSRICGSINEYLDGIIILAFAVLFECIIIKIINRYFYFLFGNKNIK